MRSSKSRSRSKSNRPRSIGNIINRVFDSSGPDGKVRGTPQQLIEKYQFLARDAQLSNDRVAAENFQQHAEHYTRMLGEAQRELAADQDARRQPGDGVQGGPYVNQGHSQNGGQTANLGGGQYNNQNGGQTGNPNGGQTGSQNQTGNQNRERPYRDDRPHRDDRPDPREAVIDTQPQRLVPILGFADESDDSGLVETPETRPRPATRAEFRDRAPRADQPDRAPRADQPDRAPRADQPDRPVRKDDRREERKPRPLAIQPEPPIVPVTVLPDPVAAEPATAETPPAPRRARAPRKPRVDAPAAETPKGPAEAAE